jgi:tRNA A37 methylthiotransferase MiaB
MDSSRHPVLLLQLPIPPPGPQPIHGNVPLAAAYLKLFAQRQGLGDAYAIDILPPPLVNALGDQGLVDAILCRQPWMVGFTCYIWNVERTLWIAERLKEARPELKIVVGGPEITADNDWVLKRPAIDYAVIGEGEQTFAELLEALRHGPVPAGPIPGLVVLPGGGTPGFRRPLRDLDVISSPYLAGILDAADEKLMFLETVRGCRFHCKFCYYPKSYDALYFLPTEKIAATLKHAADRGATEVTILDPTLNQRRDFSDFLRLLAQCNPDRQFTYNAELRSEGIGAEEAQLLRQANFDEIEIGLQSLDPQAQELMGRKVNLKAFERGARAMLDAGISVRVDLILGLPGDTVESVRRGIDYLHQSQLYTNVQVFNLSILPGTAFRHEVDQLSLTHQPRPPYYVLGTPTLTLDDMYLLMQEAQDAFGIEFDPFPPPQLDLPDPGDGVSRVWRVDLDSEPSSPPPATRRSHVFTLWLRSADFDRQRKPAAALVRRLLTGNPHSTLQIILEPTGRPETVTERTLQALQEACYESTSYLDLFYSLHPNSLLAAKRLIVLAPLAERARLGLPWIDQIGTYATLAWSGGSLPEDELEGHEYCVP